MEGDAQQHLWTQKAESQTAPSSPEVFDSLFFITLLVLKNQASFLEERNFHTRAANTPPTSGATINTHTFAKASPPMNSAGPKLLAGFTEVPVKWMPMICTSVREKPIL